MKSLFIGRWSPFHDGHKKLIQKVIDEGNEVIVAIRDTKIDDRNPYTVEEREKMIRDKMGDSVDICVIPDLDEVCYGRGVGWGVREISIDEQTQQISATSIRKGMDTPKRVGGFVVWLTGLPCSGKTTIADALAEKLKEKRSKVERLDGDVTRVLWRELGFSKGDRDENIHRVGVLCEMLVRNGVAVVTAFVSPYAVARDSVHETIGEFVEVYVKCPLEICIERDVKGMYKKAIAGEITNFTGISDPYEEPQNPDIIVNTSTTTVDECVDEIYAKLEECGYL